MTVIYSGLIFNKVQSCSSCASWYLVCPIRILTTNFHNWLQTSLSSWLWLMQPNTGRESLPIMLGSVWYPFLGTKTRTSTNLMVSRQFWQSENMSQTVTIDQIRLDTHPLHVFVPCFWCYNLSHAHFNDLQPPPHSFQITMPTGAIWTATKETAFVDFLIAIKAEAGDGGNFKTTTFQQATNHIANLHEHGPIKPTKIAHNKWSMVHWLLFLFIFQCSLFWCS